MSIDELAGPRWPEESPVHFRGYVAFPPVSETDGPGGIYRQIQDATIRSLMLQAGNR